MPLFRIWFTRKVTEDCAIEIEDVNGKAAMAEFETMLRNDDVDEISVWVEDRRIHDVTNIEFDGEVVTD